MAKYAEDSAGADFLRSQALKRLPKDGAICTKAGEMLRDQRRPYGALEAADKALAVDTASLSARRLRVACLTDLNRSEDAVQEWLVIVARPDAASDDFAQAGYLAAKLGKSDLGNSILGQGRGRFPKDPDLYVYHPELAPPEIAVTSVPTDPPGESMASEPIKGTVDGVNSQDYEVIIYARNGDKWWAQPTAASPQTHIGNDGKWESETRGGTEFAALLVKTSYKPEATRATIPGVGGDVIAVAKKKPEK